MRNYKSVTGKSISKKEARKAFQQHVIRDPYPKLMIDPLDPNAKEAWDKFIREAWTAFVIELHGQGEISTPTKARWIKTGI